MPLRLAYRHQGALALHTWPVVIFLALVTAFQLAAILRSLRKQQFGARRPVGVGKQSLDVTASLDQSQGSRMGQLGSHCARTALAESTHAVRAGPVVHIRLFTPTATEYRGPVVVTAIELGGRTIRLVRPADPDRLLDDPLVVDWNRHDDYMPYWAYLWPAAYLLAEAVAREPWPTAGEPAVDALEIGCGLGLAGLVAVATGPARSVHRLRPGAARFRRAKRGRKRIRRRRGFRSAGSTGATCPTSSFRSSWVPT